MKLLSNSETKQGTGVSLIWKLVM